MKTTFSIVCLLLVSFSIDAQSLRFQLKAPTNLFQLNSTTSKSRFSLSTPTGGKIKRAGFTDPHVTISGNEQITGIKTFFLRAESPFLGTLRSKL